MLVCLYSPALIDRPYKLSFALTTPDCYLFCARDHEKFQRSVIPDCKYPGLDLGMSYSFQWVLPAHMVAADPDDNIALAR